MQHDARINGVAFSPDGLRILTGSNDGAAYLWDASTGKPVGEPFHNEGRVRAVDSPTVPPI